MISPTWISLFMIIIKSISLRFDSSEDFWLQSIYYVYDYVCEVHFSVIQEMRFLAFIKTRKNYVYSCVHFSPLYLLYISLNSRYPSQLCLTKQTSNHSLITETCPHPCKHILFKESNDLFLSTKPQHLCKILYFLNIY